jgi:hypothetical protein
MMATWRNVVLNLVPNHVSLQFVNFCARSSLFAPSLAPPEKAADIRLSLLIS